MVNNGTRFLVQYAGSARFNPDQVGTHELGRRVVLAKGGNNGFGNALNMVNSRLLAPRPNSQQHFSGDAHLALER